MRLKVFPGGLQYLLLLLLLPETGCITFSGNHLEKIEPPPAPVAARGERAGVVEYTVGNFAYTVEGGKMITSNKAGRMTTDQLLEIWKQQGYIEDFSYVKPGAFSGEADYNLTVSGSQYGEAPIGLQIISGLSLMLIPAYGVMHYDLQYVLEDTATGARHSAAVSETYSQWMQILLLPASPFVRGDNEAEEKMSLHLYQQFRREGALDGESTAENTTPLPHANTVDAVDGADRGVPRVR